MIVNIEQQGNCLRISYVDKDRGISMLEVPVAESEMYNWEYSGSPNSEPVKSWDGKPIYKKPTKFLNKYRIDEILGNLQESDRNLIREFNVPRKWFIDIETEYDNGWAKAELATNKIQTISHCDEQQNITVMGIKRIEKIQVELIEKELRKNFDDQNIFFKYEYFEREEDMLSWFFSHWVPKMPLLTGWNFLGYDWVYLFNRCKRLGVKHLFHASPVGTFVTDHNLPVHRIVCDYLDVYKKWDKIVEVKENNTLDFVAKSSIGFSKLKMAKGLREMYDHDYQSFVLYNAMDSVLVKKIDDKLNTLQTFLSLANISEIEYFRAFSPIYITETVMNKEFIKRGRRLVARRGMINNQAHYEGAYVKTPQAGLYKHVALFDFASLYPTTQRQFNISPDSYLGKINVQEGDRSKIRTASGAVFDATSDSCMRTVLANLFSARKECKNVAKDAEMDIDQLKKLMYEI